MPTLPLYLPCDPNAQTDSWRQVRIPGGFECWRFYVELDSATILELYFALGLGYKRTQIKQYKRWRRQPTRHRPPISIEAPAVGLHIRTRLRPTVWLWCHVEPDAFQSTDEGPRLNIGSSHLAFDRNSAQMELDDPQLAGRADFHMKYEYHMECSQPYPGIFAAARRQYTASITLNSPTGQFDTVNFTGQVNYEHCFGDWTGAANVRLRSSNPFVLIPQLPPR